VASPAENKKPAGVRGGFRKEPSVHLILEFRPHTAAAVCFGQRTAPAIAPGGATRRITLAEINDMNTGILASPVRLSMAGALAGWTLAAL